MKAAVLAVLATLCALSVPLAAHEGHRPGSAGAPAIPLTPEHLLIREIAVTDDTGATYPFVEALAERGTTLLSFTYTNCETLCPLTNAILTGVEQVAAERGVDLTIVSMTIDPARDTPASLAEQRSLLGAGKDWIFLTAEPSPHRQLMVDLAVDVVALEDHDPMFLLGDFCSGEFLRIVGVPEPDKLVALAAARRPCGD